MAFTLVVFHAHPDDEVLLTGGTIARATAEGHRVVLVTATAGEAGLSGDGVDSDALGATRLAELERSAAILGCARVVVLGYADSGSSADQSRSAMSFARLPPHEPAKRLAEILRAEDADALTVYDERGGYGHPDHVQVHRAGVAAAALAGTRLVLEATVDQTALRRAAVVMRRIPRVSHLVPPDGFERSYMERSRLTHRVDVRRYLAQKRDALAAHATQSSGGEDVRTVRLLLRLPGPLQSAVVGREWFRERGREPDPRLLDDLFASLR